jgi:hypothetical protein
MTRFMLIAVFGAVLLGCSGSETPKPVAPAGPSYAEALTIYNQELDLLERLKTSAREQEAAFEEKIGRLKTALAVGDAVKDLQAATEFATASNLLSEEEAAKAKANSEKANKQLGEAGAKATGEIEKATKEHEAGMAKLNKSIQEQEAKVEQAKQVKDEAEKRKP